MGDRRCAWCRGPIDDEKRADAICCSTRCRQARHRFTTGVGVGPVAAGSAPLRLAYADPPYPGLSKRYYEGHRDYDGEVDHAELIRHLSTFDGWALSTNERSLQYVLGLCPPGVRIASWHRGERPTRSGGPLNAWEPVIYAGGRIDPSLTAAATRSPGELDVYPRRVGKTSRLAAIADAASVETHRGETRRLDVLEHFSRPRLTDPHRVIGAKPAAFCRWMFDLLGALPVDDFTDVFPGSGGVSRAWAVYAGLPE